MTSCCYQCQKTFIELVLVLMLIFLYIHHVHLNVGYVPCVNEQRATLAAGRATEEQPVGRIAY